MDNLQVFNNEMFGQVRTIVENGVVLFCGPDVAKALGYTNPNKALRDHCKGVTIRSTLSKGGAQGTTFVPEGDVYRLIGRSKLPAAEKFERWVFDEVLPTIRKTGGYVANEAMLIETYLPHADEATKALFSSTLQVIQNRTKCSRPSVPLSNSQRLFRRAKITFLWGRWPSLFVIAEPRLARNGSSSSCATRRF